MRSVKVNLEADVAGFVGPVGRASEKLEKLQDKVDQLDRSLDKIPLDAAKAGAAMRLLGGDVKDVGTNFQQVGDKSTAMTILDTRIKNTRAEVRKLGEEFIKTGDVDVFRKLGQSSGDLKSLTTLRKKLTKSIEDGATEGVNVFSSVFSEGISSTFKSLPPEIKAGVIAALGVAAVAAVPVIVSALDAALLLGLGAGGLAAGVALAAQDAQVQAAYTSLGQHIMTQLRQAVLPFKGELIGAAGTLQGSFDKVAPNIQRIFATLSKSVDPIARGLGQAFEKAMPGLEKAFQGALPLLREFAEWLPKLGAEVGDLGEALARAEPEAELFFKFLLANVDVAVKSITFLTNATHTLVGVMMRWVGAFQPISPALADAAGAADLAGQSFKQAGDTFGDMINEMGKLPKTADDVVVALKDKVLNNMMNLDQSTLGFQESLTKLDGSLKKNGHTLNFNSERGQANAEAMLAAVQANIRLFDANVASGMSAEAAAAQYDTNAAAIEAAGRKAHLTQGQINDLIGKYREVPKRIDTDIATNGLKNAILDLRETIALANNLDGKSIHLNSYLHEHYTKTYDDMGLGHQGQANKALGGIRRYELGGIRKAAAGLILPPSDPGTVIAAEPQTGGEAFIPLHGITQGRAMGLAQTVGDHYGFQVSRGGGQNVHVTVGLEAKGNADSALMSAIMKAARTGQLQITARAIVN